MKKILLVALLALASCKEVVSKEERGRTPVYKGTQGCTYSGYCFGYSMRGKYEFGFSVMCAGQQSITAYDTLYEVTYDDGSKRVVEERTIISAGECS